MLKRILLAAIFATAATPALAHLAPGEHGSFMAGLSHPLFGLDHILAMVAVGLWAAMIGGRAVWIVPSAFVGTMVVGFGLALAGVPLPFVEPAILASVVALGLMIALAVNVPVAAGAAVVALFALFHGHAHGGELGDANALEYLAGFATATALIHVAGIGLGLTVASRGRWIAQAAGALCAIAGVGLIAGVL